MKQEWQVTFTLSVIVEAESKDEAVDAAVVKMPADFPFEQWLADHAEWAVAIPASEWGKHI